LLPINNQILSFPFCFFDVVGATLKSVISYQLSVISPDGGLVGDALTATNA
jgi:hypothetical protein